jgi:hypothetical protein
MAPPRLPPTRVLRHRRWPVLLVMLPGALCLAGACAGARDRPHTPVAVVHGQQADGDAPPAGRQRANPAPATAGAGPALTEAAARVLLAERFRAAGLRVRYDVQVARDGAFALTVDGYDPARRVGFEYVAENETGGALDLDQRTALARDPEHRILLIDATGDAEIRAQTERFLQALEQTGPPASR